MAAVTTERRRRLAIVAISAFVALIAAAYNGGYVSGFPPKHRASDVILAGAIGQVVVDKPEPSITQRRATPADFAGLIQRADYVGRLIATPAVLDDVARRAGIQPDQLGALVRTTGDVPLVMTEPGS